MILQQNKIPPLQTGNTTSENAECPINRFHISKHPDWELDNTNNLNRKPH